MTTSTIETAVRETDWSDPPPTGCACAAHAPTLDIMSMLQVRNLSRATHDELKRRAARASMSLSDYVARELDELVSVADKDDYWDYLDETPEERVETAAYWAEVDRKWDPVATGAANLSEFIVNSIRERRGPLE